jgi:hypothetical protein
MRPGPVEDLAKEAAGRRGMVQRRMGLLSNAIREHLELKRLRGADPSEVIHEEREAFGPTLRGENTVSTGTVMDSEMCSNAREDHGLNGAKAHSNPDLSRLSQETVELDMRTVMGTEPVGGDGRAQSNPLPPVMSAAPFA